MPDGILPGGEIFGQESCCRQQEGLSGSFGTTYAESEDGLNFTWSEKFLNVTENPSIFEMSDGSLKLFGSSRTWSAPGIDGPWTLVDSSFPVAGKECALRSTFECPSYF